MSEQIKREYVFRKELINIALKQGTHQKITWNYILWIEYVAWITSKIEGNASNFSAPRYGKDASDLHGKYQNVV